jgi:hypothetical protein
LALLECIAVNPADLPADAAAAGEMLEGESGALLSTLLQPEREVSRAGRAARSVGGVVVGELLALAGDGETPLVRFPGQLGAGAVPARSSVDLCAPHVGSPVVLAFEQGDPALPIVLGVLHGQTGLPTAEVEVDADGRRLIVSAREQLVLRCGKASITLTRAGKVLIEGSYVLSRSTGVNRIKGGSVQLN